LVRKRISLLFCLILLGSIGLNAQEIQLEGYVFDAEKKPIEGVSVVLHELNRSTISGTQGQFSFGQLKAGHYHLHFYLIGYKSVTRTVRIKSVNEQLQVQMEQAVVELRSAVIEESTTKADQREKSQTIDIVESKEMFRNGSTSFAKLLEKIPGVSSISTGTGISKPLIRGLGFNRVVVAENGIKQEGQQWGGDHGLEIDQFAVERVELVKGPSSLLYGSDGLGGVIHIRPAILPEKNKVQGAMMATGRSVNDFLGYSAMVSVNKKDNFIRFRFSSQDYADYKVPADSFTYNGYRLPIVNQRLKNTAGNERNFQLMGGIRRGWGFSTITYSRFAQRAGLFSGAHGIPRSYQLTDDGDKRNIDLPSQSTEHHKVISNTSILLRHSWLEIDLGYQYNLRREYSLPHVHGKGPQPSGNLELGLNLQTISGNVRYHFDLSERSRWVFGLSAQHQENKSEGFNFLIPAYRQTSAGAFAFYRHDFSEQLFFNAGLRYDLGQIGTTRTLKPLYTDPETIAGYQEVSPQLNRHFGNWSGSSGISWIHNAKLNFKFNLGSSFRMPAPSELTANGIHHGTFRHEMGDATLKSERGYQSDLQVHYEGPNWFVTMSPFFNYFHDFIFLDPRPEFSTLPEAGLVYRYNQADALHFGGELQGDIHVLHALHLELTGQYVRGMNLESGYPLPFTPPMNIQLSMAYEWEKAGKYFQDMYTGMSVQYAARQNLTARNELETPGYCLLNFEAGTNLHLGTQTIKVAFNVQNLLNTKYLAHLNRYRILNLPEPGRNFMLSIMVPFELTVFRQKNSSALINQS